MMRRWLGIVAAILLAGCVGGAAAPSAHYDLILRGGTVYDGTGRPPITADVGVRGERVVAVGDLATATAAQQLNVSGKAVAPGFINALSWSTESLIADGRSQGEIRQGVTLEIFGEGNSMGPLNATMKKEALEQQSDIRYPIEWTTLAEYLEWLEARGISTNVASLIGAATVRVHELGYVNRPPNADELERMKRLVRTAMEEGALGVGSSLIYVPATFASTEELIELCKVAAEYGGTYTTHMRSEGGRFLEALDETIRIARESGIRTEIYHLKAAGKANWPKMAQAIARIEAARKEGLPLTADMYPYVAGATGLDAAMPPWVQEGGLDAWVARLKQPEIRARVAREIREGGADWESLYVAAGSPENILMIGFKTAALKPLTGKTLAEVARLRGKSPEETAIDLVIEDHTRVETAYFLMSEDNVKLGLSQPWVSIGSDAPSMAPEGVFLKQSTHPRAYGAFARFLGRYVRDSKVASLEDAIRRLTRLPAQNFGLRDRGCLDAGCYADLVVFDPARIADHATFAEPHQYSTGVEQVFVNGVQVLRDGEHTGATPGRVVRGAGFRDERKQIPKQPERDEAR
jgi:N-acyl-D-amino-acid deacylase